MEFTDRLMAVDRAVASYIRFAGEPSPPPSETVPELWADLLHWHERFVIPDPPMSKREVRRFVNEAVKVFYAEREAIDRGEEPLKRARREHSPGQAETRRVIRRRPADESWTERSESMEDVPPPFPAPPVNEQFVGMGIEEYVRLTETSTYEPVEEEDAYPAPDLGPSHRRIEF